MSNKKYQIMVNSNERGNVILPDFKAEANEEIISIADEPRRLKINCFRKKRKSDGNIFNAVSAFIKIEVINDQGKSEGVQVKQLQVHFKKDAFKGALNVHNPDELESGYLYVKAKGLQLPQVYKISEEVDEEGNTVYDENGEAKLKYPSIWVKSDVIGLEKFVASQSALDVDEDENEIPASYNEETGEVEDYDQYHEEDASEDEEETVIK